MNTEQDEVAKWRKLLWVTTTVEFVYVIIDI
jgi:hypothetical protein